MIKLSSQQPKVVALKKDRGEITTGQVFQLTDNQKETLDTVAKEEKKDVSFILITRAFFFLKYINNFQNKMLFLILSTIQYLDCLKKS